MSETPPKPEWLKALYPWEAKSLTVNGRRMAHLDEGDPRARPVLLLHGNPTWSFLYRDFIGPLMSAGYRVIAPDCIGAGYSDKPRLNSAYSLAHHIAEALAGKVLLRAGTPCRRTIARQREPRFRKVAMSIVQCDRSVPNRRCNAFSRGCR